MTIYPTAHLQEPCSHTNHTSIHDSEHVTYARWRTVCNPGNEDETHRGLDRLWDPALRRHELEAPRKVSESAEVSRRTQSLRVVLCCTCKLCWCMQEANHHSHWVDRPIRWPWRICRQCTRARCTRKRWCTCQILMTKHHTCIPICKDCWVSSSRHQWSPRDCRCTVLHTCTSRTRVLRPNHPLRGPVLHQRSCLSVSSMQEALRNLIPHLRRAFKMFPEMIRPGTEYVFPHMNSILSTTNGHIRVDFVVEVSGNSWDDADLIGTLICRVRTVANRYWGGRKRSG